MACIICGVEKIIKKCDLCHEEVCKKHIEKLDGSEYPFGSKKNQNIFSKVNFCSECFDTQVKPELDEYEATLEKAKQVAIWSDKFKGRVKTNKKSLDKIVLKDFKDKKILTLAMGFIAAEQGFNGIIEFEVSSRKIRENEYQSTRYDGSGRPVDVDAEWLERSEFYSW